METIILQSTENCPTGTYKPPPPGIGGGRAVGPQESDPLEKKVGQGLPGSPHRGRPAPRGTRGCTPPAGGAAAAGPVRRDGINGRGRGSRSEVARRARGA